MVAADTRAKVVGTGTEIVDGTETTRREHKKERTRISSNSREKGTAPIATSTPNTNNAQGTFQATFPGNCNYCGKQGHRLSQCDQYTQFLTSKGIGRAFKGGGKGINEVTQQNAGQEQNTSAQSTHHNQFANDNNYINLVTGPSVFVQVRFHRLSLSV